jgi:polyisoprenyl-teichoic acid--peptidoglycan teichoic acid transferase
MTRQRHPIDGFVPRRPSAPLGGLPRSSVGLPSVQSSAGRELKEAQPLVNPSDIPERSAQTLGISRSEIDESLQGIDSPHPESHKRTRKISWKQVKRILKWVLILAVVVAIGLGAYVGFKTFLAGSHIFKGNVFDILQNKPLKQDANGRTNILILGTSEDDPGHQGANLTDSIMVLSVDQHKKNAYMISIPRDLEVKYGQACTSGYAGKINVYFSCVGGDPTNIKATQDALVKTGQFIGGITGLDIQYGANVNYTVMRDLVNAVGGSITVTIESRDPRGQMDSNFDWKCGVGDRKVTRAEVLRRCPPSGHFIDYPNGPAILDAEHALYLAQARGDSAPTYGFEQSNFDREKNQQKIVKALREKAFSAGVLSDIGKVTGLIDALGNNLRTTFDGSEIGTLVSLAKDIKSQDIRSISLIDGDSPIMNGDGNPTAGKYQFGALQAYLQQELSSDPVTREKAKITVLNGSGVVGAAQVESDKLRAQGFVMDGIGNAPEGSYGKATIYQIDKTKTATAAKLKQIYGVAILTTTPPVAVTGDTAFVVIVGTIANSSSPANSANN